MYRPANNARDNDDESPALSPPRPFFLGSREVGDRGSYSSQDTSASDSDREQQPQPREVRSSSAQVPSTVVPESTKQRRRRSATPAVDSDPFANEFSPEGGYRRPPPSSFTFPFQSHPGNPDPLPSSRRASISSRSSAESIIHSPESQFTSQGNRRSIEAYAPVRRSSLGASPNDIELELNPPAAPFMGVYRNSVAGSLTNSNGNSPQASSANLPRTASASSFRAPFLSPASRPSSSLWTPPSYANLRQAAGISNTPPTPGTAPMGFAESQSTAFLPPPPKAPRKGTHLNEKLGVDDKPWLIKKEGKARLGWWLTVFCLFLGVIGSAVLCYFGFTSVHKLTDGQLCLVMNDDFSSGDISTDNWVREVEASGFGNGEFEMTTSSSDNAYVSNGQLYIMPTLTPDDVRSSKSYALSDCTATLADGKTTNKTACNPSSPGVPPVMSARLSTKGKYAIQYGKVEVVAKLPRGDWLWPAIWLLPVDNAYGAWPLSGEIDIMEARGNMPAYEGQGINFVRSSLNYGPLESLVKTLYGWWSIKRSKLGYAGGFHTYSLEWTDSWMRAYVDGRLSAMLDFKVPKTGYWGIGGFPDSATNGSSKVVVENIWEKAGGSTSAPFDKPFYLIMNLAVGGTSGWFPDTMGDKPWFDAGQTPMTDFTNAQSTWYSTWPESADDRAFRIDSVKMWSLGGC